MVKGHCNKCRAAATEIQKPTGFDAGISFSDLAVGRSATIVATGAGIEGVTAFASRSH